MIFQEGPIAFNTGRGEPKKVTDHQVALCPITKLKFFIPRFDPEQIKFVEKYGFPPHDAYFGIPGNHVRDHLISIKGNLKTKLA